MRLLVLCRYAYPVLFCPTILLVRSILSFLLAQGCLDRIVLGTLSWRAVVITEPVVCFLIYLPICELFPKEHLFYLFFFSVAPFWLNLAFSVFPLYSDSPVAFTFFYVFLEISLTTAPHHSLVCKSFSAFHEKEVPDLWKSSILFALPLLLLFNSSFCFLLVVDAGHVASASQTSVLIRPSQRFQSLAIFIYWAPTRNMADTKRCHNRS